LLSDNDFSGYMRRICSALAAGLDALTWLVRLPFRGDALALRRAPGYWHGSSKRAVIRSSPGPTIDGSY